MINFKSLKIETKGRTSGKLKTHCPECRDRRKNKSDRSLSVDLDKGLYHCHYCDWKGRVPRESDRPARRVYTRVTAGSTLAFNQGRGEALGCFFASRGIPLGALQELGVTCSEEPMPGSQGKAACICFNFYEQGRLVNTKFRDLNKRFKLVSGAELIPYNLDAIDGTPQCVITEGEIDALSFVTAGRKDVVSVPNGASTNLAWMDRFVESHFEDKEVIYLAVDTDRKGKALADELARRLGRERCRIVGYAEGCKDANEQLMKHGAASLLHSLEEAPEMPLEGVYEALGVQGSLRNLFENGLGGGAETGLPGLDALCTFEAGRLCVVSGVPGCGKSEFVDELVIRLGLRHDWKTAFFSPENVPLSYHLRKLSEKLTGHRFDVRYMPEALYQKSVEWLSNNVVSILPKEDYTAATILGTARELVRRRGIRILVIDPFNRLEHRIPHGQTETQYISSFLDELTNFAQRTQCLVILVAHPRKMRKEPGQLRAPVPTLYDINGSAAFFNKCDYGMVVERDREVGVTRVHVEKVKFKHLGEPGSVPFVYNPVCGRFTTCTENEKALPTEKRVRHEVFDNSNWLRGEEARQQAFDWQE